MKRFVDDLIPAMIVGFVLSFALYCFLDHGATIADGFVGKIEAAISMLFLPGIFFDLFVGGSVHDVSLGITFFFNALIYSGVLFGLLRLKRRISRAKQI